MVFKKAKTMTQIQRLVKNIRCIKYNGEKIECNTIFYCYDLSVVKQVKAKEQVLVIHADYKKNGLKIEIPKEITKIYETVVVDTLEGISSYLLQNEPKGEYVIVIEKNMQVVQKEQEDLLENKEDIVKSQYDLLTKNGLSRKDAMRKIAVDNNMSRNEVYALLFGVVRG